MNLDRAIANGLRDVKEPQQSQQPQQLELPDEPEQWPGQQVLPRKNMKIMVAVKNNSGINSVYYKDQAGNWTNEYNQKVTNPKSIVNLDGILARSENAKEVPQDFNTPVPDLENPKDNATPAAARRKVKVPANARKK